MKIRVRYSEFINSLTLGDRGAEAELEIEVENLADLDFAYSRAWDRVRREVKKQLAIDDDMPF